MAVICTSGIGYIIEGALARVKGHDGARGAIHDAQSCSNASLPTSRMLSVRSMTSCMPG